VVKLLPPVCSPATCPVMKATVDDQQQYLCATHKQPQECSAIDYIVHLLDSSSSILNSSKLFPSRWVFFSFPLIPIKYIVAEYRFRLARQNSTNQWHAVSSAFLPTPTTNIGKSLTSLRYRPKNIFLFCTHTEKKKKMRIVWGGCDVNCLIFTERKKKKKYIFFALADYSKSKYDRKSLIPTTLCFSFSFFPIFLFPSL